MKLPLEELQSVDLRGKHTQTGNISIEFTLEAKHMMAFD